MAADFLHGVETIEIEKGPRPVRLVKTAVIGLIGTAVTGPVNTPVLVSSDRDFAQFGPDATGSQVPDACNGDYCQWPPVRLGDYVRDPARVPFASAVAVVCVWPRGSTCA